MAESLKLIKVKLEEAINLYPFAIISAPGTGTFNIQELSKLKAFIAILDSLNIFKPEISTLLKSIIYTTTKEQITAQPSEANKISEILNLLKPIIENLIIVLNSTLPIENANSINIKLPDVVKDFDSLSRISNDLNISIGQILITSDINCETKIVSVENGSIWVNLLLLVEDHKVTAAIALISTLIGAAIKYRKTWYEGSLIKEQYKKLQAENANLNQDDEIDKTLENRARKSVEEDAENIKTVYFINSALDPEVIGRIKNSIKTIADWQSKGMVITPSITAKKEDIKDFPTISQTQLLEYKNKEIELPKQG